MSSGPVPALSRMSTPPDGRTDTSFNKETDEASATRFQRVAAATSDSHEYAPARCMRPQDPGKACGSATTLHTYRVLQTAVRGWLWSSPGRREREQAGAISRSVFFIFLYRQAARASSPPPASASKPGGGCIGVVWGARRCGWRGGELWINKHTHSHALTRLKRICLYGLFYSSVFSVYAYTRIYFHG